MSDERAFDGLWPWIMLVGIIFMALYWWVTT